MLSEDLNQLANGISELGGKVDVDAWVHLFIIRSRLRSIAKQVHQLEAHFVPRHDGENGEVHEHGNA